METLACCLEQIQQPLKKCIALSLEKIDNNEMTEKEVIALWHEHLQGTLAFFITEAEKRGNPDIGKKLIKYMMFKRI